MTGYILKRLVSAIPVLLGISIIVFLIMAMIPGDPATAILGSFATPENVAALNRGPRPRQALGAAVFHLARQHACRAISGAPSRSTARCSTRCWSVSTPRSSWPAPPSCCAPSSASPPASSRRPTSTGSPTRRSPSSCCSASRPVLLSRHDDDPHLRGEPALVPGLGHVADLRRRRSGSCSTTCHARHRAGRRRHGRDRAAVALGHAGGAAAGLHPHRARQGRA
jgi:hypothetical protein